MEKVKNTGINMSYKCDTWIYVAVAHGMHSMLALAVALAEELVRQSAWLVKGAGISRVAHVNHFIDGEERLEAPLLALTQFLPKKKKPKQKYRPKKKKKELFTFGFLADFGFKEKGQYLDDVNQHLKISQQFPHISVKYH